MEQYFKTLHNHNLRATKPRELVFLYLQKIAKPVDIKSITSDVVTIDRVTIYRTLDAFIEIGIVSVVPFGWKRRYELAEPFIPHRHHIVCINCGASRDIRSTALEGIIHQAIQDSGYKEIGHSIEVTGYCSKCQKDN